MSTIHRAVAGE